jgi:multiple sugar transport system permease protein
MDTHEQRKLAKGLAFLSPWLIGFLVFTLLPAGLSLYYSLCDYSLLQRPQFIGATNYRMLMADDVFWKSIVNTFYYALLAIPCSLAVSIGLAMLLNVKIAGQGIYRTVIFLPSLVPMVASSMLWLWLLNGKLGLINALLAKVGIHGPAWLSDVMFSFGKAENQSSFYWAMPALAFMSLWGVGHTVTIFLAGLQDVPAELYEAAEIDGASAVSQMRNVTLPMLSPVIFFNLIMSIIGTLQVFAIPYIMTGGGPARGTYFLTMYLYDSAFRFLRMGYASAMAWVQLLIVLSLTGIAFWSSKRWVHYQGK